MIAFDQTAIIVFRRVVSKFSQAALHSALHTAPQFSECLLLCFRRVWRVGRGWFQPVENGIQCGDFDFWAWIVR
jgi:hypothetical protein